MNQQLLATQTDSRTGQSPLTSQSQHQSTSPACHSGQTYSIHHSAYRSLSQSDQCAPRRQNAAARSLTVRTAMISIHLWPLSTRAKPSQRPICIKLFQLLSAPVASKQQHCLSIQPSAKCVFLVNFIRIFVL